MIGECKVYPKERWVKIQVVSEHGGNKVTVFMIKHDILYNCIECIDRKSFSPYKKKMNWVIMFV